MSTGYVSDFTSLHQLCIHQTLVASALLPCMPIYPADRAEGFMLQLWFVRLPLHHSWMTAVSSMVSDMAAVLDFIRGGVGHMLCRTALAFSLLLSLDLRPDNLARFSLASLTASTVCLLAINSATSPTCFSVQADQLALLLKMAVDGGLTPPGLPPHQSLACIGRSVILAAPLPRSIAPFLVHDPSCL